MAGSPITWRTIYGQSLADASRPTEAAKDTFNGGFDIFGKLLKEREDTMAANVLVQNENQKNAFLDALSRARTPQELEQMRSSGEIDRMLASLPSPVRAEVRDAPDSRLNAVRQLITQQQTFDHGQRAVREAPIVNEAKAHNAAGRFDATRALLARYELQDESPLELGITTGERAVLENRQKDDLFGITKGTQEIELNRARRTEAEDLAERNALRLGALAASEANKEVWQHRNGYGVLAKELGMPVDATGAPNILALTPAQQKQLDEAGQGRGLPAFMSVMGGDTARYDKLRQAVRENGAIPAEVWAKVEGKIRPLFDTSAEGALLGNDDYNRRVTEAQQTLFHEENSRNNWYDAGSDTVKTDFKELSDNVGKYIDRTRGWDPDEDIPYIQQELHQLATEGIKMQDGSRVVPPVNDIIAILRSTPGDPLYDFVRARDFRKAIEKHVQSSYSVEAIQRGRAAHNFRLGQKLKESIRNPGTK